MTTPTEINTVIAERVMGLKVYNYNNVIVVYGLSLNDPRSRVLDFFNCLNAMHEAEVRLFCEGTDEADRLYIKYERLLMDTENGPVIATPQQRATAMYEVLS